MLSGRYLFNFMTPVVYAFQHLDIVLDGKTLLLLTWKFKHNYTLSIQGLKRRYKVKESAVIVKIPSQTDVIEITISSLWRKKKYSILLKRLKLSKEASHLLISQLKPLKMPDLRLTEILVSKKTPVINISAPVLKSTVLNVHQFGIQLQKDHFVYPQNKRL